ncbi:LuxR C-terminal-related transcriptional regulator [Aquihabitans sp. G128]|uniref:helix-turn-helix transcriptional regulator n=1 Tax=Aquihabitans sp. G128 TaxID=2849779 RepID=UPI001C216DD7|nr:LuxR family transcriptional regulator [Aquihabitans sp. G128]QXC60752.1 LuxR C-terminal-related transcriptional regulator [Aquihabitans sp. G128]
MNEGWPLARRQPELDAFSRALDDPDRTAVVLYGPAGVGKSRLADACLARAEAAGRLTARVMASQAAALLPLGALAPVLPHVLTPSASPSELFDQTRTEFLAMGGGGRLVLLVDDAHLLDTSSAVLLTQLLAARAVFVVATIRDGEPLPDAVAGWWRLEGALRLDIVDLDRDATADVLGLALGGVVGTDTVRRLHDASGGNPLLLRELVVQAVDAGLLRDDSGTWRLSGDIPPSRRLVDVLATRLAALGEPARRVVDQLAVCAPLGPAELTGDVPLDELESLERSGLIRVLVDGHRHQLVLGHPLYGEALRADLTVLRRRSILLAAADRIEALGARRREDARRVATWRLDAGGTPDPALLLQATRVARYAHDFKQVERLATVLWSLQPTAEAAVLLGEAAYEMGHFDASEAVLAAPVPEPSDEAVMVQRATLRTKNLQWGLCDWRAALAVIEDAQATLGSEHADDLVAEEGAVWMFAAQPQKAIDTMAAIAPHTARTRVLIALIRGQALASVGRTAEGIEAAIEGFREHSALAEPLALAHPGTHIVNQSFSLVEAGRFDEADEMARLGYDVAVADNIPVAQIWFALMLAKSCTQRGRINEARRWFQEGASTARLHGFNGPERIAQLGLASAEAVLGNVTAAAAAVARGDELPEFEFLRFDQPIGRAWTAWAQGDPEQARSLLATSAADAATLHNVGSAAWLWHDAARLGVRDVAAQLAPLAAASDSPVVAARAEHVRALEAGDPEALAAASVAFEALDMVLLAAEAAAAAADAHRRKGQQRLGTNQAHRATQLADRCPGARTPGLVPSDGSVPLSTREREIATLAGQGVSSQEIADRLFLSIRTVNNHLQNVYTKLGVNRRDQLAEALGLG